MTELLLNALASWRLTRLLQRDEITRSARNAVIEWTLDGDHPQLRYLVSCPHCLSIWLSAFVLALRWVPGGRALRDLLAVAGAVSAFSEMEPALTETDRPKPSTS